jgi:hypothetical protein
VRRCLDRPKRAADSSLEPNTVREEHRIRFLLQRDGLPATIAWVRRTLRIYRIAVLDKSHYASSSVFRKGFIESYCDFKRWLREAHAYGASDDPS